MLLVFIKNAVFSIVEIGKCTAQPDLVMEKVKGEMDIKTNRFLLFSEQFAPSRKFDHHSSHCSVNNMYFIYHFQ